MTNAQVIANFLDEQIRRDDVPGRMRKVVVCHIIKGNKLGDEIRAVSVPDEPNEEWRHDVAKKIAETVAEEAIALSSGVQRYAVQALFEGDDKPRGRVIVTAQGDREDGDALDTEGPDGAGLVTASMGQARFFAAAFGRSSVQQIHSLEQQVQRLTKENEDLRSERLKSLRTVEELMVASHERAIENRREDFKQKALEDTVGKLGMLVPMAVNHMAGRKILPENAPERMLVRAFAERMTPAKLQALASSGALDEAELAAFINILQSMAGGLAQGAPPAPAPVSNGVTP